MSHQFKTQYKGKANSLGVNATDWRAITYMIKMACWSLRLERAHKANEDISGEMAFQFTKRAYINCAKIVAARYL